MRFRRKRRFGKRRFGGRRRKSFGRRRGRVGGVRIGYRM